MVDCIVFMAYKTNIKKMSVLPTLVYRFNAISIKIPAHFLGRDCQVDPKIYLKTQRVKIS